MSKVHFRFEDLHVYNKSIQYGELVPQPLINFLKKKFIGSHHNLQELQTASL